MAELTWEQIQGRAARRKQVEARQKAQAKANRKAAAEAKRKRAESRRAEKKACVKCGAPCRNIFCPPCAKRWYAEKQNAPVTLDREFREIVG